MMIKRSRVLAGSVLFCVVPLLSGCDWLNARDNMNKGVRAFRETNYQSAVEYFTEALSYDPDVPNGQLYLGLSYSQQYIPDLETPENMRFAEMAVETLEGVLEDDPTNATAIAAIASIFQNTGDLQGAREYYLRQAGLDLEQLQDPSVAYYSVGSIDWWILFADDEGLIPPEERTVIIDEGQEYLDRALEFNEENTEAMAMKNLLYRQAALLIPEDTEDPDLIAQRDALTAMADEWYDRTLEVRADIAERSQQGLGVE